MKHAYLIIAHNNFITLKALLTLLDDERNDVFVHIDHRSEELYNKVCALQLERARMYVLGKRLAVYWGNISQVEAEYLLLETALLHGEHSYYHLLSGVDLPIQKQSHIHRFFNANRGKEFVGYWWGGKHTKELQRRTTLYHYFTKHHKRNHSRWHSIATPCANIVLILQKITGFRRKQEMEFCKGPNWCSITEEFCKYLIERKPFVMKRFKHTLCPDEIFLQTILWNSPFKDNIYDATDSNNGNLRLIDWNRGNPYVWQSSDFDELQASGMMFARKFGDNEPQLLQEILNMYEE